MGALFALASAGLYGIADFAGGLLARRAGFAAVALIGQVAGLLAMAATAPFLLVGAPSLTDLGWGALSGVGSGVGMVFLYRGMSAGQMSVVVPVSAVGSVALPVLVAVLLLGERPSAIAWLGIALAIPALWFVSRSRRTTGPAVTTGVAHALVASVGFAVQYAALAQAARGSGIWPVVAGRLAATCTILSFVMATHALATLRMAPREWAGSALTGAVAAWALVFYLLATREDIMTIAVVLSSLYPVIPAVLGIAVLRERLSLLQSLGLVAAIAAIGLLTAA